MALRVVLTSILIGLILTACGGGGPSLDARVLQLHLTYSIEGPTDAVMQGTGGAAATGSTVECRLTGGGRPVLGTAVANETGSFEMPLDLELMPRNLPDAETFRQLNDMVECRSGTGSWVTPLRQPMVRTE